MSHLKFSKNVLEKFCKDAFGKFGFSVEESSIITDVLITADMYGIESHGMQRLSRYHKGIESGRIHPDGRLEIVDAIKKIYKQVEDGEISVEDIDEELVSKNLYTAGLEDPSLIIRTSGEERLSGFLLWQSSYSELYFCDSLWPELRKVDYLRAIRDYQARDRRFGV